MENIKQFLEYLANSFETGTNVEGDDYVMLNGNASEPMRDFVRKVHGDKFLPDDYRYATMSAIVSDLLGYDFETFEELQDNGGDYEITDGLVSVNNAELTTWLASHLLRGEYIENARREGLIPNDADVYNQISVGQSYEIQELYNKLVSAIDELSDDDANAITNAQPTPKGVKYA